MSSIPSTKIRMLVIASAATMALGLSACGKSDDGRTAGQKVDTAIAKAEQKAEEVKADAKSAAESAKESTANAVDAVADKARDAAITASVKAELAKDSSLSALSIDVDTVGGRVALHGTAPDASAQARATALASAVDGVKSVDNQLTISPKG